MSRIADALTAASRLLEEGGRGRPQTSFLQRRYESRWVTLNRQIARKESATPTYAWLARRTQRAGIPSPATAADAGTPAVGNADALYCLSRTTGSGGDPSRDRRQRNARDTEPSNAGLPRCRVEAPSTSDTERPDRTPRPEAGLLRPRVAGLPHRCYPRVARL